MKKILLSALSVGVVAIIAVFATQAYFSDEEKSVGNVFEAGAIDLKVDYDGYYNKLPGVGEPDIQWAMTDLTTQKFFELRDVKPGDFGEGTVSLHVYNNDAWGCVSIIPTVNDDVDSTEPELEAVGETENTDSIFDGELAQNMSFMIWADVCNRQEATGAPAATPGDNIYQESCDTLLTQGKGPITPTTWALADSQHPNVFTGSGSLVGSNDYYLGVSWSIPTSVGNIIQTDKYMADVSFYVEQQRNNPNFLCSSVSVAQTPNVLRLENERQAQDGPWEVIVDGLYVDMTYNSSGSTFVYTLDGHGLPADTSYDLIYYADGWPGNHPGALIGKHSTDGSGLLTTTTGNVDLSMDLPHPNDGNFAVGAKIWMIPDAAYDDTTKSVVVWPPDFSTWLFEGNVYIHYDDTDISYP